MSSSKGTLRQIFICLRRRTPYPSPLHTKYLFWREGGEQSELERKVDGQQFTKLGRKYQHVWLYRYLMLLKGYVCNKKYAKSARSKH
jgi:hypothetical protein